MGLQLWTCEQNPSQDIQTIQNPREHFTSVLCTLLVSGVTVSPIVSCSPARLVTDLAVGHCISFLIPLPLQHSHRCCCLSGTLAAPARSPKTTNLSAHQEPTCSFLEHEGWFGLHYTTAKRQFCLQEAPGKGLLEYKVS